MTDARTALAERKTLLLASLAAKRTADQLRQNIREALDLISDPSDETREVIADWLAAVTANDRLADHLAEMMATGQPIPTVAKTSPSEVSS